ncbi:uncharacterized protein LOC126593154 isoform X2 [Malus sylvestris]|uniref:uncharacterized protein LOC126593154 isoform X2 n=1 Tax=Malus sylvestris TaxID=3752 RepID=UPI0021ABA495|nr:uncharacterized protein LOC126593154 isoform X2 [Malus sylvestris]
MIPPSVFSWPFSPVVCLVLPVAFLSLSFLLPRAVDGIILVISGRLYISASLHLYSPNSTPEAMDARDSDSVNLSDEESMEIIMGTERDFGSESIDNTNTSLAKKKARAINLGNRSGHITC